MASKPFALRFMLANRQRLVNVDHSVCAELDELERELFAGPVDGSDELDAPRESNGTRGSEDAVYLQALEKLERQRGSASRRAHLEVALAKLSAPHLREKLLLEASRIEVQAVLEKVDSLKTRNAKIRHLSAALAAIRSDDVPDELQMQEIAWLEEALADLTGESG